MAEVIHPTDAVDFITLRELGKTSILTSSERSTTNRESDNECCDECEDGRLTWSERQAESGLIGADSPSSNKPAGVMSTCEVLPLEIVCGWCGLLLRAGAVGARTSHGICEPCRAVLEGALR